MTVEPAAYVPVIPAVLAFGAQGIATGFSCACPQYHPVALVDASLSLLDGAACPRLTPWYRDFAGEIVAVEGGEGGEGEDEFLMRGRAEWRGEDLHVTEVPCTKKTEAYEDAWRKVCERLEPGASKSDVKVHTVLKKCTLGKDGDARKKLGLEARLSFANVHLLDAKGKIRKYERPQEVVAAHATERLALYRTRLAHQVTEKEDELSLLSDRARFIDACVAGTFDLRVHDDEAAVGVALVALGFAPRDGGFAHLVKLPLSSLTAKRAAELRHQREAKAAELEALRQATPEGTWRAELQALRAALLSDDRYKC